MTEAVSSKALAIRGGVTTDYGVPENYRPTQGGEVFEGENFTAMDHLDGPTRGVLKEVFGADKIVQAQLNHIAGLLLRQLQAASKVPKAVAQMASVEASEEPARLSTLPAEVVVATVRDAVDIVLRLVSEKMAVSRKSETPGITMDFFPKTQLPHFTFSTPMPRVVDESFVESDAADETRFLSPAAHVFVEKVLPKYREVIIELAMAFARGVYENAMVTKDTFKRDIGNPFSPDDPGKMPPTAETYSTSYPPELAKMAKRGLNGIVVGLAGQKARARA